MISAIFKGINQLGVKSTRKPLWIGVMTSLVVFAVLWGSVLMLLKHTTLFEWGFLEAAIDLLGGLAVVVLTWVLFPGVVSAVVSIFLDQVADSVEETHYPGMASAPGQPFKEALSGGLRFFGLMVALNLALLPFLITGIYPILFYAVNGYLLGREYFELVATRRLSLGDARRLRKDHRGAVFTTGLLTAVMLTIPVLNLLTPVIATAAMVHLYEGWRTKAGLPEVRTAGTDITGAGPDTPLKTK